MKPQTLIRVVTVPSAFSVLKGQLGFIQGSGWNVLAASGGSEEELKAQMEPESVPCTLIPNLVRPISLVNDVKALWQLIRLFRREKPHIVHANTPKGSLLAMMAAWLCRVPHRVYTVTGLRFETTSGLLRWLLITMERITCACATKVIPEGQGVRQTLYRERITRKSLSVLHNGNINGINLDYFARSQGVLCEAEEIKNRIGGTFTFLFVGRIVRDKGIEELVEAYERIQQEEPSVRLLLVGSLEPELDPLPQHTLERIRANSTIIEVGFQNDVRPWFAASHVFVFPSHREGFPNVVLQAGALGLPSIVTNINGSNEIIRDGENGYIVPVKDSTSLYAKMKELLNSPSTYQRMSANARPLIASRYLQSDVWSATLLMYQQL